MGFRRHGIHRVGMCAGLLLLPLSVLSCQPSSSANRGATSSPMKPSAGSEAPAETVKSEQSPSPIAPDPSLPPPDELEIPVSPAVAAVEPMVPAIEVAGALAPAPSPVATGPSGGLGLSGIGEGGGGIGEGIGLGDVGTIGRGAGSGTGSGFGKGSRAPSMRAGGASVSGGTVGSKGSFGAGAGRPAQPDVGVKSGEWDDNANFREFQKYLVTQKSLPIQEMDLRARRFVAVRDAKGKAVPNCPLTVSDVLGHKVSLRTPASGRAILFPFAEGLRGKELTVTANCGGSPVSQKELTTTSDGLVDLQLTHERALNAVPTVDVVFVLDTTGSMGEEIDAMKSTIERVARLVGSHNARLRIGLVEYRDRTDPFVARVHQMTTDINGFIERVSTLSANGGGDAPEDVQAGMSAAIHQIHWNERSIARLAFIIGDAPPKLDYADSVSYSDSMRVANRMGIQFYTVAASGMDDLGQAVFRQVAQYTGATSLFVLRGGAGPQSVGGGDPMSSCGGTQKEFRTAELHKLIAGKVQDALTAVDADPRKVEGLHQDLTAKPCRQ